MLLTGPLPTPAIAVLTRKLGAAFGVVISASHNPYYDNGIKFFDPKGMKLPDEMEDRIAEMVLADGCGEWDYPPPEAVGRAHRIVDASGRYIVASYNFV